MHRAEAHLQPVTRELRHNTHAAYRLAKLTLIVLLATTANQAVLLDKSAPSAKIAA